jgi:hypothetical protein
MLCSRPVCVSVSVFDKSQNASAAKFLDGSFNNNHTNFGSKSTTHKPVQPSAKLLNNWFNGNTTIVYPKPKSMADSTRMLMRPM